MASKATKKTTTATRSIPVPKCKHGKAEDVLPDSLQG